MYSDQLKFCLYDLEMLLQLSENKTEWIARQIAVLVLRLSLFSQQWNELVAPIGLSLLGSAENAVRQQFRMDALHDYYRAALCIRFVLQRTEHPGQELLHAAEMPELQLTGMQPEEFIPVLLSFLWQKHRETIREFSIPEKLYFHDCG